jgi:hypothetical protein
MTESEQPDDHDAEVEVPREHVALSDPEFKTQLAR